MHESNLNHLPSWLKLLHHNYNNYSVFINQVRSGVFRYTEEDGYMTVVNTQSILSIVHAE